MQGDRQVPLLRRLSSKLSLHVLGATVPRGRAASRGDLVLQEVPSGESEPCLRTAKSDTAKAPQSRETLSPVKDREAKPVPMVFRQLIKRIDEENPSQFRLPQDIRQFFSGGESCRHCSETLLGAVLLSTTPHEHSLLEHRFGLAAHPLPSELDDLLCEPR